MQGDPFQACPSAVVRCLKLTKDLETFDDLRLAAFNSNSLKMDFEKFPACQPMQESIFKRHIQWFTLYLARSNKTAVLGTAWY